MYISIVALAMLLLDGEYYLVICKPKPLKAQATMLSWYNLVLAALLDTPVPPSLFN